MVSFVKAQMKAASKILVDRLIKKAELLDSGALLAMMENGRLRTVNPMDRSHATDPASHEPIGQPPMSPPLPYHSMNQANIYGRPPSGGQSPNRYSAQHLAPRPLQPNHQHHASIELPGDTYYQDPRLSPNTAYLQPSHSPHATHSSVHSEYSNSPDVPQNRWSWVFIRISVREMLTNQKRLLSEPTGWITSTFIRFRCQWTYTVTGTWSEIRATYWSNRITCNGRRKTRSTATAEERSNLKDSL